jgi:hypothetical protein
MGFKEKSKMPKFVHINRVIEAIQWVPDSRYGYFDIMEDPHNKGYYLENYVFVSEGTDEFGVSYTLKHPLYYYIGTFKNDSGITYERNMVHQMRNNEWIIKSYGGKLGFIPDEVMSRDYLEIKGVNE